MKRAGGWHAADLSPDIAAESYDDGGKYGQSSAEIVTCSVTLYEAPGNIEAALEAESRPLNEWRAFSYFFTATHRWPA